MPFTSKFSNIVCGNLVVVATCEAWQPFEDAAVTRVQTASPVIFYKIQDLSVGMWEGW